MGLVSYCICLSLLVCGCLPGIVRAKQVIQKELRTFECGHLVGELFLQMLFCAGVVMYIAMAHAAHTTTASIVLGLTGLYLIVGLFLVTGENQEDESMSYSDHTKLGWPLMVFQAGRLATMLALVTISFS